MMATKSKWFRVGLEGATTDGREIARQDIVDMAANYNRDTYGARVNLEHYRGLTAGSPFDMLGDVLALKSQIDDVQIGGKSEKRMALYAQIEPLKNLIELNKSGQKIFTSIEIQPDFAKTGKAGLVGLAVTDSPASLGTEVLAFAAQNPNGSPFKHRKQSEGNLFTEGLETQIEFVDDDAPSNPEASAFSAITKFFNTLTGKAEAKPAPVITPAEEAKPGGGEAPATGLAQFAEGMAKFSMAMEASVAALTASNKATADKLEALEKKLESEPDDKRFSRRPPATGGDGRAKAVY